MCSYLGALRINLPAQFWTCWSLSIVHRGRPAQRELQESARKDKRNNKSLCCGSVKKMANRTDASELVNSPIMLLIFPKCLIDAYLEQTKKTITKRQHKAKRGLREVCLNARCSITTTPTRQHSILCKGGVHCTEYIYCVNTSTSRSRG